MSGIDTGTRVFIYVNEMRTHIPEKIKYFKNVTRVFPKAF